jgi:hypothetical protein
MSEWYHCFSCRKVTLLVDHGDQKCPSCDGTKGEILPQERLNQGFEAGVYFNIDPATGKRTKKNRM